MDVSIEAAPATEPTTAPDGREPVASFAELKDALAALWAADGGQPVAVHIERPGAPLVGRWWPRLSREGASLRAACRDDLAEP
jgi:hypothetical protein